MKPQEYIKNVLVTESRDFAPLRERMSKDRNIRLLHGALGLCTESAELFEMLEKKKLDLVNLKEENGDNFWYLGVIIDELGFNPEIIIQSTNVDTWDHCSLFDRILIPLSFIPAVRERRTRKILNHHIDVMIKHVGLLQDLMKKSIFYGKPLAEDKLQVEVIAICKQLAILCGIGDIEVVDCLVANINKLRARYGEKFTEAAALERDLAREREILEKK